VKYHPATAGRRCGSTSISRQLTRLLQQRVGLRDQLFLPASATTPGYGEFLIDERSSRC
jgi:hypothetical protein